MVKRIIENKILLKFQRLLFNSQPEFQFRIPNHFKFQCQFQRFLEEVPGPELTPTYLKSLRTASPMWTMSRQVLERPGERKM